MEDAKRVEGHSRGTFTACKRALPEDNGKAGKDFKEGVKGKESSRNYPVLNIWLRFQFLKRGLFPFP